MQMNVLMLMFAGSDTSRESHKMLLGILPELQDAAVDKVCESPIIRISYPLQRVFTCLPPLYIPICCGRI